MTAADIDFEALAHVLANTCRRGGCMRATTRSRPMRWIVSEEIEALDGLGRRGPAAAGAARAGRGRALGLAPGRLARLAARGGARRAASAGVEAAVREAAGLDAALDEERAELLRFVTRMAAAAERRDLLEPDRGPGHAPAAPAWPSRR